MGVCASIANKGAPVNAGNGLSDGKPQNNNRHTERKKAERHGRVSIQSTDSGITMRPAENLDHLARPELMKLTKQEIEILFSSFETIKKDRDAIANDILAALKAKVPGAMERLEGVIRRGDSWEKISQGIIVLSGIERCLLRLTDRKRLDDFVKKLVSNHIKHFNVPKEMLLAGLDVSAAVVLKHLGLIHQPLLPDHDTDDIINKHIWQNCVTCSAWATFFELMHKTLEAVNPEVPQAVLAVGSIAPAT